MKFLILAACFAVAFARPSTVEVCEDEVKYTGPLASDLELIDGLTPEVHEAREKHLRLIEEIRRTRPANEEEYDYEAPLIYYKKEKFPLASEIELIEGMTPEVHAAREEHFRIKSEIERNLPKEEIFEDEYRKPAYIVRKEKFPLASEIELIDGMTPEVHAAREEHFRIKSEIERNLPKEESTVTKVTYVAPVAYKKEKYPLASEIELIDGLTPEVHAAREEHLNVKAYLEKTLPSEDETTTKFPLASDIHLIDGQTPEVHAAREEHFRIKSEIESTLPKEDATATRVTYKYVEPTVVYKKEKYPLASEIELIDGMTPEVHAAREEHFRIKSEIEKNLPKETVVDC